MKYSYNKLWKLLIDKNMMKKDLMELTKINSSIKETYERTEYAGVLSASEDAPALGEHPLFLFG